ncbi:carbohydrate porin [Lysobacter sp. S4-A87]|uniref:carbohydrate porin n=1 Tax=Lysobacter sp. S4-A87 TaxID=2925843 RepID=UPI001F53E1A8|nr:carbohydrate porin [Lysobacter sp. S4-A87]UNK49882.1 carbohydrate porin [Lysobacter sp. S4-A87]
MAVSAPAIAILPLLLAVALPAVAKAEASGDPDALNAYADRISGDWGGARTALSRRGIDMSLSYINEWLHNSTGGERDASAYADQFAVGLDANLEALVGWPGASFHVLVTNRNGPQLDAKAGLGTLLETHEIYGRGHYTRLTRFYLQQSLFDQRVTLNLGRSDVDFFPLSCDFINISFCGPLPGYHSNGWYTWPIGQYFANVTFRPTRTSYLKLGASDVNPRNLDGDQGLRLRTPHDDHDGILSNVEAGWLPRLFGRLDGAYRIGFWRNSTDQADLLVSAQSGTPLMRDQSTGYYAMAQQQVWFNESGRLLTLFANLSRSDPDVDRVDRLISLGLWLHGPFAGRPHDRVGFAVGQNRVGAPAREAERLAQPGAGMDAVLPRHENPVELNYQFAVLRGVQLMPSVQHVRHPGGRSDNDSALVWGLKLNADF